MGHSNLTVCVSEANDSIPSSTQFPLSSTCFTAITNGYMATGMPFVVIIQPGIQRLRCVDGFQDTGAAVPYQRHSNLSFGVSVVCLFLAGVSVVMYQTCSVVHSYVGGGERGPGLGLLCLSTLSTIHTL